MIDEEQEINDPELSDQDELYEHHRLIVDKGQSLLRVDKFLFMRMQNISRNRIQQAVEANAVLVNEKPVKSSYKVKPDDVVTVVLSYPPREIELYPDDIPLNIVYEDEYLAVVDKPAGMVVHPAYGNYRGTLVNAMIHHMYPNLNGKPVTSDSIRPGLVHRIDKNTSGLIVIAKNEIAMTNLAKQFYDHSIKRLYKALVWGDVKSEGGTITANVGRSHKDRKVMDVFPDGSHGKFAVTHYKVLERFNYVTLVECRLETGRTHQIRVHMKHIGHPLFNDETYGGNRILKGTVFTKYRQFVQNCFLLIPRQALHAYILGFNHPILNKEVLFESQLPDDMNLAIEKWRKYAGEKALQ